MPARLAPTVCLLAAFLLLSGCDTGFILDLREDSTRVAGRYRTTAFTVVQDGQTIDVHAAGGFIEMNLSGSGSVQGRLFVPEEVPGASEDGGDVDIPFGGTFTASGDRITFSHAEDTFIRDAEWTFARGELRTNFQDVIHATLRRQVPLSAGPLGAPAGP